MVGPGHTFAQLADAINHAFARWDPSHLHEFQLADGRRIGFPGDEFAPELAWEDHAALKVAPGEEFSQPASTTRPVTGATPANRQRRKRRSGRGSRAIG
jgi:hypothetical protein